LRMGSELRLSDDELFDLCARNPELRIERTAAGDLIVMTPAGGASGHRNLEITSALAVWARSDSTGVGFDSSTGFVLPNGAMRAPDAAWVLRSRLEPLSSEAKEKFLPLCPDFVVELRSPADRLGDLQARMEEYRDNGARLGWLVDPQERRVHVYRPGRPAEVLEGVAAVSGDPELAGLVLELEPVWRPI
ncbi:MAG TPA: Uma2 family endonuclease, partial [Thermoanaerobaculia bacterium]|nr:Uma2 family endonuclease [Thermoanaerobaculia bacterium]